MQKTDIMNMALSKMGEEATLLDPSEPSRAARAMNAVWDATRDSLLRSHFWNFAMRRRTLNPLDETPEHGFTHIFQLPEDFLRLDLQGVTPTYMRDELRVEGRRIVANDAGPLSIVYTARIAETGEWDALFCSAMAARLAFEVCEKVTGSAGQKQGLWQEYRMHMAEAKGVDGRETPPQMDEDSSWLTARYSARAAMGSTA